MTRVGNEGRLCKGSVGAVAVVVGWVGFDGSVGLCSAWVGVTRVGLHGHVDTFAAVLFLICVCGMARGCGWHVCWDAPLPSIRDLTREKGRCSPFHRA